MIWMTSPTGPSRIGLIVPKFQSTAVARNRLRRRLREIWRRELQSVLPAGDLLIRARREAYGASFPALKDQLVTWSRQAVGPAVKDERPAVKGQGRAVKGEERAVKGEG